MREIIIKALAERIKVGKMTIEETPEIFREEIQLLLDVDK